MARYLHKEVQNSQVLTQGISEQPGLANGTSEWPGPHAREFRSAKSLHKDIQNGQVLTQATSKWPGP